MKKFIQQISPKQIVRMAVTMLCVLIFGLITLAEGLAKARLYDQQAAGRWSKQDDVAQISCFFAEKEVGETSFFLGVRASLDKALQQASISADKENARLWIDAISRTGKITIANGSKSVELEAVGVMGDFFQFHLLDLKTGSFFGPDSMMQDGIIIDEETAWQLFGSSDVVGMQVMIGQIPHYITGVIERETGRIAKAAGLDKSICYLSLENLERYGSVGGGYCYEAILPNPVENFALSTLNTAIEGEKKEVQIVENSSRYGLMPILQVVRGFGLRSMSIQGIVYPYWENIARAYEDIFALALLVKCVFLVFPCVQGALLLVWLWKRTAGSLEKGYHRLSDYAYDYGVKHQGEMKKRWVFVGAGLSLLLVVLVVSIGIRKEEETSTSTQPKDASLVYREEDFFPEGTENNISQFTVVGDTLYVEEFSYGSSEEIEEAAGEIIIEEAAVEGGAVSEEVTAETTEETEVPSKEAEAAMFTRIFTAYDFQGDQKNQIKINIPENTSPGGFTADNEGNIYSIYTLYSYGEDGAQTSKVYLQGHSSAGEEIFTIVMNENEPEQEFYYVNALYCVDDTTLIMETTVGVEIYNLQGEQKNIIKRDAGEESRLMKIRDDKFALIISSGQEFFSQILDIETGQRQEQVVLPFNYYLYSAFSGPYYDLYLTDEKGVYGFNLGDEQITPVMNYLASDISSYGFSRIGIIDETNILASYYGEEGEVLALFSQIPEGEVIEKAEVTLGCYFLDDEVKKQVVSFNKESKTHRIEVIDYSTYNTEEDYTIGMSRLNSDIASGKVPDIILLQNGMPIQSYISKGVFADYYELMEQDADFNKEDYLTNIFSAYELDGKLHQMTPLFSVRTFVGKTALVGEDYSWTMDEALALERGKPEGTKLFTNMTQNDFLFQCLYTCGDEYVDWETGECYFNTDKFIRMLEYAKTLPKENLHIDYEDQTAVQEMEMQYREERTILNQAFLSSFEDYGYWKYATFGEDITMVGFPTESGIGSSLGYRFNLAISEQSKHKQAAWEFVKSFLSEEYQDNLNYYFPIRISSLEKMEEKAWEKPHYLDEKGNKVEYEYSYWIGEMEIVADPLTKEETGAVIDFMKSINRVDSYNENIINIVTEEAALFLAEEKTAQEVAEIIQSRVKIYVNENR